MFFNNKVKIKKEADMKKKTNKPILSQIFQKVAPRIGATIIMEPEWGVVGQIIFKNGRKRYFRFTSLDINTLGASEVAKDKDFANFFMRKMGYPTISGKTFFLQEWAETNNSERDINAAYLYAKEIGLPVIVKPNSGSQGACVSLVYNKREFYRAIRAVFKRDRVALVQQQVKGKDYRFVVLDNQVISAYQRISLNVIGDGFSTIFDLLREKQNHFINLDRDTKIKLDDPRIIEKLKRRGLSLESVIDKGERVYLLDNANLSTGGDAVDVTKTAHSDFKRIAVRLTRDMGLRLCGVDFMINGDVAKKPAVYWILEINSAPGLDHYAQTGSVQKKIVEDLYLKVLKSMEK